MPNQTEKWDDATVNVTVEVEPVDDDDDSNEIKYRIDFKTHLR